MRVSQLIKILELDLGTNGDRNIYNVSGHDAYEITYLGAGCSETEAHFWITSDPELELAPGEDEQDFRAPPYKAPLILVK